MSFLLMTLSLLTSSAYANDLCTDATTMATNTSIAGDTTAATFDDVGSCGTSNTAPGVWYSITLPESGVLDLSTCNDADYDTKISVFSGDCGALVISAE